MSQLVTLEKSGPVALAVMRAPKANALSDALVGELRQVLQDVADDPSVGCLALLSGNRSFCSGADLEAIKAAGPDPLEPSAYAAFGRIYELFALVMGSPVPPWPGWPATSSGPASTWRSPVTCGSQPTTCRSAASPQPRYTQAGATCAC